MESESLKFYLDLQEEEQVSQTFLSLLFICFYVQCLHKESGSDEVFSVLHSR